MQGQSQQESVRKSNISCKDSPGLNWLDRWVADMPWEGPKNSSDNERKIDSTVSEHTKLWSERTISQSEFWVDLLQCHHQLRVLRLHPHLSPHFPSHEVSFRKEVIIESLAT